MAYYWVTEAQKYIQSLGFGTTLRPVNKESQDLRINQWGADIFSWDEGRGQARQGRGRRRGGRWSSSTSSGTRSRTRSRRRSATGSGSRARSTGRGLRRLLGGHGRRRVRPDSSISACVADTGLGLVHEHDAALPAAGRPQPALSENINPNSVHATRRIWSRALAGGRKALGHQVADTLILEGHFGQRDPTMRTLAESTVAAANRLYGASVASTVRAKFVERGIL